VQLLPQTVGLSGKIIPLENIMESTAVGLFIEAINKLESLSSAVKMSILFCVCDCVDG